MDMFKLRSPASFGFSPEQAVFVEKEEPCLKKTQNKPTSQTNKQTKK
jgi:hypothetical protein